MKFPSVASLGLVLFALAHPAMAAVVNVNTAAGLVTAVNSGAAGDTVNVAPGTYILSASLTPKPTMIIKGAGMASTILKAATTWNPGAAGLPDNATSASSAVRSAYMVDLGGSDGIKLSDMTLDGIDQLHGAVFGTTATSLEFYNLGIRRYIWSGIRTWSMSNTFIHDCEFEDAGGVHAGTTGGGLYLTWPSNSQFYNNRFFRSTGSTRNVYGIKGRQSGNCRMYNNTITTNFSIEWPHENDSNTEIDHNYMTGVISIPKNGGGGSIPVSGVTFHIHHNYFTSSYALEWSHNGVEVDHNLFNFSTASDGGNLISAWSDTAQGPTKFHNNLIKNPGRGCYWSTNVYNNYSFYNNHVIANTTVTPRTEGLFGFNSGCNFSTISIKDNIIECIGQLRPLVRNTASNSALIENNTLTGITDTANYANTATAAPRGPTAPLNFDCGVRDEYLVNDWNITSQVVVLAQASITGYDSAQDGSGGKPTSGTVGGRGTTITLAGNAWKKHPLTYTVTAQTVLEVTVDASDTGELLGVSLDTDNSATNTPKRSFRFGGSDANNTSHDSWGWKVTPLYTVGNGPTTYTIPVGTYFTGAVNWLGFIGDDDATALTLATFSHIRLYELP